LIQIIGKIITAYKLAFGRKWKQIFFDTTTRQKLPFQAFITGLVSDDVLDPVIVPSCIFMEDESTVKEVESIKDTVSVYILLLLYLFKLN